MSFRIPDAGTDFAVRFSECRQKALRAVAHGQDVNLVIARHSVHNAVRAKDHFADQRVLEFRHRATDSGNAASLSVAARRREMTTVA